MTIFSIGLGIGTIALYAINNGFITFLNGMVDKYGENESTSEYILAGLLHITVEIPDEIVD